MLIFSLIYKLQMFDSSPLPQHIKAEINSGTDCRSENETTDGRHAIESRLTNVMLETFTRAATNQVL